MPDDNVVDMYAEHEDLALAEVALRFVACMPCAVKQALMIIGWTPPKEKEAIDA